MKILQIWMSIQTVLSSASAFHTVQLRYVWHLRIIFPKLDPMFIGARSSFITSSMKRFKHLNNLSKEVSMFQRNGIRAFCAGAGSSHKHVTPADIAKIDDEHEAKARESFERILSLNAAWVERTKKKDPHYFEELASNPQKPEFLWIGCSDSRVPANEITRLGAGELFVHRNIANVVVNTDLNLLSVLQFSVEVLKVKHVIVAGHYGCGGVKAAMHKKDLGLMENWIRNIRDVERLHADTLNAIPDENERWNKLVELNVREGCIRLMQTGIIQKAWSKGRYPMIHGLVYDLKEGLLRELDIDYEGIQNEFRDIYGLDYYDEDK
jgi:carbonic anhydrase